MKKVMFVTYGGVHANLARLICQEAEKSYETVILALTVAPQMLKRYEIPHKTIKDYLHLFHDKEQITVYGEMLAKTEYNENSGIEYEDCVAYLGLGFRDLVRQEEDLERAAERFQRDGRKAFCPVETMKTILKQEQPDVLVLTSNVRYERAAGLAANALGIPVIHVHDLPVMLPLAYEATVCLMNEYARKYVVENGICPAQNVRVTGQPVLEDNTKVLPEDVAAFKETYHVDRYDKVVTFLEQPNHPSNASIEALFQRESKEHPDILYIAKLHPNQDMASDRDCDQPNYIKSRDCNLKALLSVSGVAITYLSNSGMEAALMGVPLIVAEIDEPLRLDFSKYGIAAKATSMEQLKEMIYAMLNGTLVVRNDDFNNVPNATKNIVSVIGELIEE